MPTGAGNAKYLLPFKLCSFGLPTWLPSSFPVSQSFSAWRSIRRKEHLALGRVEAIEMGEVQRNVADFKLSKDLDRREQKIREQI